MYDKQVKLLTDCFGEEEWFDKVVGHPNKLIVFVHWMDSTILKEIPDTLDELPVLVHYSESGKDYIKRGFDKDGIVINPKAVGISVAPIIKEFDRN